MARKQDTMPRAPFGAVMADPPWQFRDRGSRMAPDYAGDGRRRAHYATATLDTIKAMRFWLDLVMAPNAFLFLWAPHAFVLDGQAQDVARAWGFEPKQEIPWVKTDSKGRPRLGGGKYGRVVTEPLLLCRRGKAQCKPAARAEPNIIFAPRPAGHSAKPDEAYAKIERMVEGPYLELYGRRLYSDRWAVWGDQIAA